MSSLSNDMIAKLLKEEQEQISSGSRRGPKVDLTQDRTTPTWMKLPHHLCMPDCEHRTSTERPDAESTTASHRACWNPNCVDPRPENDRGMNIVSPVKGQYICRYCFLAGYLK